MSKSLHHLFLLSCVILGIQFRALQTMAQQAETDHQLVIHVKSGTYMIPQPDTAQLEAFWTLSETDRQAFLKNRTDLLTSLAKGLQSMRYGFGTGVVIKDQVHYVAARLRLRQMESGIESLHPRTQQDARRAFEAYRAESFAELEAQREKTLMEKGTESILGILRGIDHRLWSQPAVFAKSNEFGMSLSVNAIALVGKQSSGYGGLLGFGVSIGYNREQKALVFQIYRELERYESSILKGVAVAGVLGKVGLSIHNHHEGLHSFAGRSAYPPMAPVYGTAGPDHFSVGASTGLTVPPSPIADALTYNTKLDSVSILRVVISPTWKGFLRVETGITLNSFKALLQPIKESINYIINSAQRFDGSARLCKQVLIN